MRKHVRRAGCLLVLLVMLPMAALAGAVDDIKDWLLNPGGEAVRAEMRMEAVKVPEFGGVRLEWLNRLLGHLTFELTAAEDVSAVSVLADGRPAVGAVFRIGEENAWAFSFDPGQAWTLPEGGDLLAELSGETADLSRLAYMSQVHELMDGFYRFFEGLPAVFPENASESKINNRYNPYGTAVKKWSINLPEDVLKSEKMTAYLQGEGLEAVREYLTGVVLAGRQRLTLQTDAEGHLMKVNYTARAGLSAGDLRSVNLDWRCLRRAEGYKDVLTLTTPGGGNRDNLTINQELVTGADGHETYTGTLETDRVLNRVRTRKVTSFTIQSEGENVTGSITEKTYSPEGNGVTNIVVNAARNAQDEYRGSIEIIQELDKIEQEHFRYQVTAGKGEAPVWQDLPVRPMTESDRETLAEKAAVAFLTALIPIPEEDLQYFLADLPEGWWTQMTMETEHAEETKQP